MINCTVLNITQIIVILILLFCSYRIVEKKDATNFLKGLT